MDAARAAQKEMPQYLQDLMKDSSCQRTSSAVEAMNPERLCYTTPLAMLVVYMNMSFYVFNEYIHTYIYIYIRNSLSLSHIGPFFVFYHQQ